VRPGPEGPVLVLLDHGLTVEVPPELVGALKETIVAISSGDFDAMTDAFRKAGLDLAPGANLDTLLGLVGVLLGNNHGEPANTEGNGGGMDLSRFALDVGSSIGDIPNDLLLVGRAIGLMDGINRQLAPDLNAVEIVARYVQRG
jgi:predicted unusual protein kinase regulating ubiquinone biosynthesis (AarF/ABC1/UbiB family)